MLASMKYKSFVWPNNPKTLEVESRRSVKNYKYPFGGYMAQDMGLASRTIKGEGEFFGCDAYDSFRRLAAVFSQGGSGWLEHPIWPPVKVFFSKLKLTQEPKEDCVRYSFEFTECADSYTNTGYSEGAQYAGHSRYVSAQSADTLSTIAVRYSVDADGLAELNPGITGDAVLDAGHLVRLS